MGSSIRLDEGPAWNRAGVRLHAALAGCAGAAFGLWLGLTATGLPPGTLAVCSVSVLIGVVWLGRGLEAAPTAAFLPAACGLGAGWAVVAAGTGRMAGATFFAALLVAAILALAAEARDRRDGVR